ncbi:MAG: hypothetical protein NC911_04125, partial [Candidatus Omnitrophica bacterium]|nr:hypothetical protein [Candidatus Omnitrophota bacterium]
KEKTSLKTKIDWKKLGFDPGKLKIEDCITLQEVSDLLTAEGLNIDIAGNLFRMLLFRPKE